MFLLQIHDINQSTAAAKVHTEEFPTISQALNPSTVLNDSAVDQIPTGAEIIPSKLVLRVKRDSYGHYIKHKTRLVVLNNLAAKNISLKSYSPTINERSMRLLSYSLYKIIWQSKALNSIQHFVSQQFIEKLSSFVLNALSIFDHNYIFLLLFHHISIISQNYYKKPWMDYQKVAENSTKILDRPWSKVTTTYQLMMRA